MTITSRTYNTKTVKFVIDKNQVATRFDNWATPGHFSRHIAKGPLTTTWIWNLHADVHAFDSQSSDLQSISRKIFSAHFGQLGLIISWIRGIYYHGAKFSNYEVWLLDPNHIKPSRQVVWALVGQEILNGDVGGGFQGVQITSGIFYWWRANGITTTIQLYSTAIGGMLAAFLLLFRGWFHYHKAAPRLEWFENVESMLNHHLSRVLGMGRLAWAGHQIHISIPINCLIDIGIDPKEIPLPHEWILNTCLITRLYPSFGEGLNPFFCWNWEAYNDILTFHGGLEPTNGRLLITDEAHHHVAIAVIFLVAGHIYRTKWSMGHSLRDILEVHQGPLTGYGHGGIYEALTTSWHSQLSLNLATLGSASIIVRHHIYSIPPYPYIGTDYSTQISLFTHHIWIGGILIVGSGAHRAIFMVRDYDIVQNQNNLIDRVIRHRDRIISHLNWVSIFLGLHSFGLYIHNDTISGLGRPQDIFSDTRIQVQPVFAQIIQKIHILAPKLSARSEFSASSRVWGGDLVAVGGKIASRPITLGTSDFIVHHIHAFTIHVTVLILLKGVLYRRSSRLLPDKIHLGFRFPCDGPGRGGTCQISSWDHIFLGLFWIYNRLSIVIFHFSWKIQSDVWGSVTTTGVSHITGGNFAQSSTCVNGWLRDFLWAQSSQVIQSYGSSLSAYGLIFLGAHFVWAFSLIFLFSGRGYWQELIESIRWAHVKLRIVPYIEPRALSITQGRAVGVAHYLLGGIRTTWSFFIARLASLG
jgi:photosystem I P700 chlorophyll a apoprotein A1